MVLYYHQYRFGFPMERSIITDKSCQTSMYWKSLNDFDITEPFVIDAAHRKRLSNFDITWPVEP